MLEHGLSQGSVGTNEDQKASVISSVMRMRVRREVFMGEGRGRWTEVGLLDQQSSKTHPAVPLQPVMVSFDGRGKGI